ncbi:alpha-adducin isoform X1 [Gadus chalcogrammus]|uniref:alpha-adducin isoform X1 n=1 Tax=Gadus chalcogrammus TaxID=1042646 RepID=UPI0024C4D686|nr:alpha-adducin isoform X1 [Gadus chalcogrammus]
MNGDSGAGVVTAPPPTAPHKERYFDRVDESSPEYQRERNMAPDLRQDFNMMEQRKRVSMILQSPAFCDELETMIQDQMKTGKTPTSLLALQQIADFMTTSMPSMYPAAPQGGMAALNMSLGMVTPVNDLRGSDSISYDKGEKLLRCKLAAFYRLTDLFNWSQLIYNHLTVRVNSDQDNFLIVPFGLLYSEVTASSLVKVNVQGEIVDRGSTNLGVNQAGFTLHSAIYSSRPDIKCIVHIHSSAGAAVSAMKCGLLPISPEALSLGEVAYHDYHGILVDQDESVLIQKNLGPTSKVLILRNHGLVAVGETVEEAFYYIHNLITACEIQVRTLASAGGPDNLVMLDPGKYKQRPRVPETPGDGTSTHPKWQVGEQEFEALMRMLDNLGYRTGYPYRCPALQGKGKKYSDATELPPHAHSHAGSYSYGEDSDSGTRSPLKHSFQRGQRPAAPPLSEEGADSASSPKAKAKWTKEEGQRQAAVANQFIPMNTNSKDVLEMRNKIRDQNLQDIKTAGPQSQVLCAGSVTERTFTQGELVTASKAIIEKEYQPRVVINKQGPNPFNRLTDQELDAYRKEVELKQKGPEVPGKGDQPKSESTACDGAHSRQTKEEPSSSLPLSVSTPSSSSSSSSSSTQSESAAPPAAPAATPLTPSSVSDSARTPVEPEPASGGNRGDGTADPGDEEVPESPEREFHCAVLRALSKEAPGLEKGEKEGADAEAGRGPGTAERERERESPHGGALLLLEQPDPPFPLPSRLPKLLIQLIPSLLGPRALLLIQLIPSLLGPRALLLIQLIPSLLGPRALLQSGVGVCGAGLMAGCSVVFDGVVFDSA